MKVSHLGQIKPSNCGFCMLCELHEVAITVHAVSCSLSLCLCLKGEISHVEYYIHS